MNSYYILIYSKTRMQTLCSCLDISKRLSLYPQYRLKGSDVAD